MDADRWQWIQNLFHQAAGQTPAARQEFLAEACAGDGEAMVEVLSLLEEEERSGSMLDRDVSGVASLLMGGEAHRTVGPYRVLRLLGEGGMGVVYLGERDDLDHHVALKLLPDAWMSPARRGRFAVEQRTLSRLNHPSITRLYDAGTLTDGTPWFAMEYVEGLPITEFCENNGAQRRERLQLFRKVCEAVQYAHQQAVLHRDLKPSNILVKADGTVRLLDFGIAKPLDRASGSTRLTQAGLSLSTPAYASPEQLRGEAPAIPFDVYSLGVILCELLTGKLTLSEGRALGDADLEVLCRKATHADPARRYGSAEALIRDLDHYLRNEPLEARPDDWGYRFNKFVSRHRLAVAVSAVAAITVAGVIGYFTWRLAAARDTALGEAARAQRIQKFLVHLFEGGEANAGPAEDLRVLTLVDRGAREASTLGADPAAQGDLYHTLGTVYQSLGKFDKAGELLESSLSIRRRIASPAGVGEGLVALSLLKQDQGKLEESEKLVREAVAHARKTLPPKHPMLVEAVSALGRYYEERGQYREALRTLEEALAMLPSSETPTQELSSILMRMADSQFYLARYDEAEALTRRALEICRRLYGDHHPRVADPLINLGSIEQQRARFPEGERHYRQALEINRAYYGKDHPETAAALIGIAKALQFQKRYAEARPIAEEALAVREKAYGKMHPTIASSHSLLGVLAHLQNRLEDAERHFRQMGEIYRQTKGAKHSFVAIATANLGGVFLEKKDYARAERTFREAIAIYAATMPADHFDLAVARVKLGRALMHQGRHEEARKESQAGLSALEKKATSSSPWIISARKDLARIEEALKR